MRQTAATVLGAGSVGLGVAVLLAVAGQRVTLMARAGWVACVRDTAITVSFLHGEHALPTGAITGAITGETRCDAGKRHAAASAT
jgi:ketopantoate reductase